MNQAKNNEVKQTGTMPLFDHLAEVRKRLIFCVLITFVLGVLAYVFYEQILAFLTAPFAKLQTSLPQQFFVNTIFEGFTIRLKVALWSAVILGLPFYVFHILRFVFPALNLKEKKLISLTLLSSFLLIIGGFCYGYFSIIPSSIKFLTAREFIPQNAGLLLSLNTNIFYVFTFILAFVIVFQIPIVLLLLLKMSLIKRKPLFRASRYIIILIFIVAAVLTPPDFISQICMAFPLIILYFLAIGIAKICKWGEET